MGNYSRNPQAALQQALDKGYTRVRFQQGKPILDRELNLMGDLAGAQGLARHYVGNGVPAGSDGFAVTAFDFANNDFTLRAGRCVVNGLDVVLASNTTYKNQPVKTRVAALPAVASAFVYLRAFTSEVSDAQDPDLGNGGDIGFETALRERVEWEVVVSTSAVNQPDHFLLADFSNVQGNRAWRDRRVTGVTLSRLREDLNNTTGSASGISARLDNIMTGNALTDGVVTNGKIADGAVTDSKLAGGAVTTSKLADDAVTSAKLAEDSVGTSEIQDNAVTTAQLANASVTNDKLGPSSVGTGNIRDGAVTAAKLGLVTKISGTWTLFPGQTVAFIPVEENITSEKVTPYFVMVAPAWTFGFGNIEVSASIVYRQDHLSDRHSVFLRLGTSLFTAGVDVLYRVDALITS